MIYFLTLGIYLLYRQCHDVNGLFRINNNFRLFNFVDKGQKTTSYQFKTDCTNNESLGSNLFNGKVNETSINSTHTTHSISVTSKTNQKNIDFDDETNNYIKKIIYDYNIFIGGNHFDW
jgi:competence transcription factor ComK